MAKPELVYGYCRVPGGASDDWAFAMDRELIATSLSYGWQFVTTFHEWLPGRTVMFDLLVRALREAKAHRVLVPTPDDLSSDPNECGLLVRRLREEADASVMVLDTESTLDHMSGPPLAYGYIRPPADAPDGWSHEMRRALVTAARSNAMRLATVYAESTDDTYLALDALIEELRAANVRHVLVPSLGQLSGGSTTWGTIVERLVGADAAVIAADGPTPTGGDRCFPGRGGAGTPPVVLPHLVEGVRRAARGA